MKTKWLLLPLLLVLPGCGGSNSESSAHSSDSFPNCYHLACAKLTPAHQLGDLKKQYQYPNPNRFPDKASQNQYRQPHAFLDLKSLKPESFVSPNLQLQEFAALSKGRYAVILPILIQSTQKIREQLGPGLRITSGYRSPGYNAKTPESASWSRHTYGDGVDMQHSKKGLKVMRQACINARASFYLLYARHIHCDWRDYPLDPAYYPQTAAQNSTVARAQNARALERKTQIFFKQNSDSLTLATVIPDEELEGEPLHHWRIIAPSGRVQKFENQTFEYAPEESGLHFVEVDIGGFYTVQGQFSW